MTKLLLSTLLLSLLPLRFYDATTADLICPILLLFTLVSRGLRSTGYICIFLSVLIPLVSFLIFSSDAHQFSVVTFIKYVVLMSIYCIAIFSNSKSNYTISVARYVNLFSLLLSLLLIIPCVELLRSGVGQFFSQLSRFGVEDSEFAFVAGFPNTYLSYWSICSIILAIIFSSCFDKIPLHKSSRINTLIITQLIGSLFFSLISFSRTGLVLGLLNIIVCFFCLNGHHKIISLMSSIFNLKIYLKSIFIFALLVLSSIYLYSHNSQYIYLLCEKMFYRITIGFDLSNNLSGGGRLGLFEISSEYFLTNPLQLLFGGNFSMPGAFIPDFEKNSFHNGFFSLVSRGGIISLTLYICATFKISSFYSSAFKSPLSARLAQITVVISILMSNLVGDTSIFTSSATIYLISRF